MLSNSLSGMERKGGIVSAKVWGAAPKFELFVIHFAFIVYTRWAVIIEVWIVEHFRNLFSDYRL
jgi:hypothetical protein